MKMSDRYAAYVGLKVSLADQVLTIKFDNPPLNSMTSEAHEEMSRV